jgi:hypothetical protein
VLYYLNSPLIPSFSLQGRRRNPGKTDFYMVTKLQIHPVLREKCLSNKEMGPAKRLFQPYFVMKTIQQDYLSGPRRDRLKMGKMGVGQYNV